MRKKRVFLKTLSCLFVLLLLASCSGGSPADGPETTADTTTEGATTATETEPPVTGLSIGTSELQNYRIIYPRNGTAEEAEWVMQLQTAILERYGVSLEVRDDFAREGTPLAEAECEILVGACERTQSERFSAELRTKDFGYRIVDKKLVIAGGSGEATVQAIEAFLSDGLGSGGDTVFSNEKAYVHKDRYDVPPVLLNGTELGAYRIVYPKGNADLRSAAQYLSALWESRLMYRLPVREDSTAEKDSEILLGETARDVSFAGTQSFAANEYLIAASGSKVLLAGASSTMVYRAIGVLDGRVATGGAGDRIELSLSGAEKGAYESSGIRVMTFNIRCNEFTEERIDLVFRMIDLYAPDTIGFQEATVGWMNVLKERLGDRYGCVGVGRNADHSGEASPVFYLKSKFELLDSGTKWMSETPDVAGSKVAESSLPRVFSYAELKMISTGQTFVHVNTHLEHTSEEARVLQAGYLVSFLEEYRSRGLSYVVTGDYNCTAGAGSYNTMINSGLRDALDISEETHEGRTYHGYGTTSKVIDHIFVSEAVEVSYYKACTETFKYADGSIAYPSDHNPVVADCEI